MTLEDFFTLTEMKDGLTTPSRVQELVAVMQKDKDSVAKNVGDATRQWAAVASAIASTENRDCLDLFIQLDGLSFIEKWLKEAERFENDAADGFAEESLAAVLRALEKLCIDKERSVSSGIWTTVNNLLDHASSRVQERARVLFDSWKQGKSSDTDATENSREVESSSSAVNVSLANVENGAAEPARDENLQSSGSVSLPSEKVKEQPDSNTDSPPLMETVSVSATEKTALTETHSAESDFGASKKLNDSNMVASPSSAKEDIAEAPTRSNDEAKESDLVSKSNSSDPGKSGKENGEAIDDSTAKKESSPDMQPDLPVGNKKPEKAEDLETPFSHILDMRVDDANDDEDEEQSSDVPEYLKDGCESTKTAKTRRKKRSNVELDALEVARQVAHEVEREVVGYTQQSSSSSSDNNTASRDIRDPDSPDSINMKKDKSPGEDTPSEQNQAAEADNGTHELDYSQVTEVAPERETKAEKGPCGFDLNGFDLNQEVCSEDMEHTVNPVSNPVSVVSASRPTLASGSPSAPLQFEGILGWKGSAATSAFRPAKVFETGESSNSSKQRKDSLGFDLNVAEDGDDRVLDLMPRSMPVSSGLKSGESSLEVGPRRPDRPNLDLNMASNEGDAPLRMEGQLFVPRNGHRSPSPASSSSSMQPSLKHFDLNDRPLFPHPHNSSDQGLHGRTQNAAPFGLSRPGDPVISIFGARVEVGNRSNGKPMDPMMNADVARIGGVMGIPAVQYTHSPMFGYNGLAAPPHMYGAGGSIPYMMDTRLAPVLPQISPYSQPSFMMNMAGGPSGPSRSNFDLNSGFANEGGNAGNLGQFVIPGQSRSLEDQLRANVNVQPSPSLGLGVKRREPDGGWDSYSLPYKHLQPPWR